MLNTENVHNSFSAHSYASKSAELLLIHSQRCIYIYTFIQAYTHTSIYISAIYYF